MNTKSYLRRLWHLLLPLGFLLLVDIPAASESFFDAFGHAMDQPLYLRMWTWPVITFMILAMHSVMFVLTLQKDHNGIMAISTGIFFIHLYFTWSNLTLTDSAWTTLDFYARAGMGLLWAIGYARCYYYITEQ
ncbi:MAG: hypothetical protein AAF804_20095, partial [Bacteroidota bacterium]